MAGTVFESQTPGMCRCASRTTAAATTGPARQPRPTSSTPATWLNPMRRKEFSSVRKARTLTTRKLCWLLLLAHACRLALQLAQEIQLRAANTGSPQDLDLVDDRRVQRED